MRLTTCVVIILLVCSLTLPTGAAPASVTAADISVVGGSVVPKSVSVGGIIQITVIVENTGDVVGSKDVQITASGTPVATLNVTVQPGETATAVTTVSFGTARSYFIRANGVDLGTVEVTEGSTAPETEVIETAQGATVTIGPARIGQQVNVSVGDVVTRDGTGLTGLDIAIGDGTGGFRVEVTPPQASAPSGVPPVRTDFDTVQSLQYLQATPKGEVPVFDGVTYRFRVASSLLPDGTTPVDVILLRYDTERDRWVRLSTTALGDERYRAESPGFSTYAIAVRQPQPEFVIRETSISTLEPTVAEEEVTVTATIANEGDAQGSFTAELTLNGDVAQTASVTLGPGETTTVEFAITFPDAGSYTVRVGGREVGTVTPIEMTETETTPTEQVVTDPPRTPTPTASGLSTLRGLPLGISGGLVVVVGLFMILLYVGVVSRRGDGGEDTSADATAVVAPDADPDERMDAAEDLVTDAEAARTNGNFDTAVETYDEAIAEYTAVQGTLSVDDDRVDDVDAALGNAQDARSEVATLATARSDVEEALAAGERQFLEGIIAHVQGESVLAKTQYRSARSRYQDAEERLADTEADEVLGAVSIQPETQASLDQLPEALATLSGVSQAVADTLADAGVTTPSDLADSDLDIEVQLADVEADAEEIAVLTALAWWQDPDTDHAWTLDEIRQRIDHARRGRDACL